MSWEANHVYAPASGPVLNALCWEEALARGVYVVRAFPRTSDDAREPPYAWPEPGLTVVRELAPGERRLIRWTEDEVVSWRGLDARAETDVIAPSDLGDTYISHLTAPPAPFLRFLKDLSWRSDSPVAYYHRDISDDGIEEEFAWTFGDGEAVLVQNGETTVTRHDHAGMDVLAPCTVLALVLRYCGIPAPDGAGRPVFPLHAPDFPWHAYRYDCARA